MIWWWVQEAVHDHYATGMEPIDENLSTYQFHQVSKHCHIRK
jgi:hypothetical protein